MRSSRLPQSKVSKSSDTAWRAEALKLGDQLRKENPSFAKAEMARLIVEQVRGAPQN